MYYIKVMTIKDLTYVGDAILSVDQDGFLRWFRYEGKGQEDASAGTGWNPNSGNKIGNGW